MIPLFTADEEIKILRETLRDLELKLKMREECLNNLKEGIRSMATAWFKVTEVVAVVADSDRVKEVVNSQQLIKQQRDRVVETRQQMQDARDAKIIALHDDGLSAYQRQATIKEEGY